MRGHLSERRPGVWRLTVSAGFDEAGRRQRVTRTIRGGRRDAERALTSLLRDLDAGTLTDGRQPLGVYLEREWLPAVSKISKRGQPLAPTTRQRYQDAVRHVSGEIGRIRLCDLRARHVEALRERLLLKGLAPQTVGDVLRVLSQALTRAEARGYCRNWASSSIVDRPARERSRFEVIDHVRARTILDAVTGTDPWDVAVHLALGVGLRREEVLALRWEDLGETASVRRALTYAAGEYHVGPPKSVAGEREIPLPNFVATALRRHRAAQAERLLPFGIRSGLVVDNGIGEQWLPASFSTGWRRFAEAHGFEGVTFHTLRHGAASLLLAAGVADTVALDVMGHADTTMLRHYQEVADQLKRDAAARMEALLGVSPKVSPG